MGQQWCWGQKWCRCQHLGHWSNRLDNGALATHNRIETVHRIRGVLHNTACAVSLDEGVGALNHIAAARLLLALYITGRAILRREGDKD